MPTPAPASGDHLERNLSRLRRADPQLASRIAGAFDEDVLAVAGPSGATTLSFRGTLLASAYDPAADGERLAARVPDDADVVVALGVGTGHQLDALQRRGIRRLIVFEPHTGLLRAAFAARPFAALGGEHVSVVTDEDALCERLTEWYSPGLSLHVLPHPGLGRVAPETLRSAVARVARTKEAADVQCATLRTWSRHWALTSIENGPHLLGASRIGALEGAFSGAPAVVCAAGPSLPKQLPLVARYRSRVLVIAIGQSLAALERAGVRPDLVVVTETQDVSHQLDRVPSLGAQNLVLVPQAHPRLFELSPGRRFLGFESSNPFAVWLGAALGETAWLRSGGTVAVAAVGLAAFLGAGRVMLIGQDLAFTDGRRYAEGSLYEDLGVEQEADGSVYFTDLKKKAALFERDTPDRELAPGATWVEGWNGDRVLTDVTYASFREEYRALGGLLAREGVRLVNCTEGGARIPGIEHRAFGPLIEEVAHAELSTEERLAEAARARTASDPGVLLAAARALEAEARALRADAKRGAEKLGRFARARAGAAAPLLRSAQQAEHKVRERLGHLPMVGFLVQGELHDLQLASRSADGDFEGAVRRSRALLATAQLGADGLLKLLSRLRTALR